MTTQEKIQIIGITDKQGRVVIKSVEEKIMGSLNEEWKKFRETVSGQTYDYTIIYRPETDAMDFNCVCLDVYGKVMNHLSRTIEDDELVKETIKTHVLKTFEEEFKKNVINQFIGQFADRELEKRYAPPVEPNVKGDLPPKDVEQKVIHSMAAKRAAVEKTKTKK